jgi:ABC-type nitrate/sulfonate/bicarbonate transport systems, periplasmic components
MKRIVITALLTVAVAFACSAQKVRYMPAWTPQAQFAGYYMALEKGFYAKEGLDVEIEHVSASSSKNPLSYLEEGAVDFCTMQFIPAVIARGGGARLVNVLQHSQNTALMCVSHEPLKTLEDLSGKKVGRWCSGSAEIADMFCNDFNVKYEWVYFINNVNLFVSKAIDATLCYSYNEYLSLLFARGTIPESHIIKFSDLGYNFPEDGLYVNEDYLAANPEIVSKFVKATIKGWQYAAEHREETVDVVMRYVDAAKIVTNKTFQRLMLDEVLSLQVNGKSGAVDFSKVDIETFTIITDNLMNMGVLDSQVDYNTFIR